MNCFTPVLQRSLNFVQKQRASSQMAKKWLRKFSSAFIFLERNKVWCGLCHKMSDHLGVVDFMNYKMLLSHSKTMGYMFHMENFYDICK